MRLQRPLEGTYALHYQRPNCHGINDISKNPGQFGLFSTVESRSILQIISIELNGQLWDNSESSFNIEGLITDSASCYLRIWE